jgi:hypothetical protein
MFDTQPIKMLIGQYVARVPPKQFDATEMGLSRLVISKGGWVMSHNVEF